MPSLGCHRSSESRRSLLTSSPILWVNTETLGRRPSTNFNCLCFKINHSYEEVKKIKK